MVTWFNTYFHMKTNPNKPQFQYNPSIFHVWTIKTIHPNSHKFNETTQPPFSPLKLNFLTLPRHNSSINQELTPTDYTANNFTIEFVKKRWDWLSKTNQNWKQWDLGFSPSHSIASTNQGRGRTSAAVGAACGVGRWRILCGGVADGLARRNRTGGKQRRRRRQRKIELGERK